MVICPLPSALAERYLSKVCPCDGRWPAVVAAFDTGAVEDGAVGRARVEHLALENASVLQREVKDITMGRVRPGIELHDRSLTAQTLQAVPHAAEISMTPE